MRLATRLALAAVIALSAIAAANVRSPHWDKVRDAISKGLPQTALESIDPIIRSAQDERKYPEAIQAITLKIALEAGIQGNRPEEKITRMQAELERAPAGMRPVMEAILANWYWQYFQSNRWRFVQRTATTEAPGEDFTTWDLPRLYAEIDRHFTRALAGAPLLQRTPVSAYDRLLSPGSAPDPYRPTLYDFVVFQALQFYGSGEQAGARPEDAFVLQAESPAFGSREEFLAWSVTATDTASPLCKGVRLYQDLLRFHAADRDPAARIDADLWRIEFAQTHAVGATRDARYAAALERAIERDSTHELSARALHSLAALRYGQGDPVTAHRLATRGLARFPESVGGRRCFNLLHEIEAKSLYLTVSERVWNAPTPTVEVIYRNLDRVHFRLVPFDFEGELEKGLQSGLNGFGGADPNLLLSMTPRRQWSATLPGTPDHRARTERLPVPSGLPPGAYYLVSSARSDFSTTQNQVSVVVVWISDLALVLRQGDRPLVCEGFVLEAAEGAPVEGAEIRTWRYNEHRDGAVAGETVRTDRNGLFRIEGARRLSGLLVTHGGQRLGMSLYFPIREARNQLAQHSTMLFTDRAIYRPGQAIQYKGLCIALDPERNDYTTLPARSVTVVLADPNGREVARAEHTTNGFGSFSGSFTAPEAGLRGAMMLRTSTGPSGAIGVSVEEYKRPKFMATLDAPRVPASLAGRVELTGRALAYSGAPIDGARVEWRVKREVRYPAWWGWRFGGTATATRGAQAIAHGTATTDAEGRFSVTFTALPDSAVPAEQEPTFDFSVSADVTDGSGETRSAARSVRVGYTALMASLLAPDWQETSRAVGIGVRTTTLDDAGQAATGTLTVTRLQDPERLTRAEEAGWDYEADARGDLVPSARQRGSADHPTVDPENTTTWLDGPVVIERSVRIDSSGQAKIFARLAAGLYRARFETTDRFGRTVTALLPLRVLDPSATRCALHVRDLFVARETSVEPGGEFLAVWGTAYASANAYVEVEHRGRILQAYWTRANRTQVAIRQRVDAAMRGGFTVRVTRVAENRAYLHEQFVAVPWTDRMLNVRWEHFVSKLQPGRHETWTAVVSGPDATRVAAEMVATLYDASLDAFAALDWGGIHGFRQNDDQRNARFDIGPSPLWSVYVGWSNDRRDGSLEYRGLPPGLLWGDYTYGFGNLLHPGAPGKDGTSKYGTYTYVEEMRAPTHVMSSESNAANQIRNLPVGSLSEVVAVKAGVVESGDGLHFRGGRSDEAQFQFDGVKVSDPPGVLDLVVARSDLRETAFFHPHLRTDAKGAVRIEFTVPEALTGWRFLAFAHDNRLRSGTLTGSAVTSKDLMVQPNPPRFLREGDEVEFTVKVTNRTDQTQRGSVRLQFTNAGDDSSADAGLGNDSPEQALEVPARASRTHAWRIRVPDGAGVLKYQAVAASAKLSDGEEGWLPVLARRVLLTESLPLPIRGPATKAFDFERLRRAGESATLRHQALTVQMVSNPAWYAVMALPYLIEYPYECSEQVFNRLYANSLARHVANSDPRIRSVFERWRGTPALDSPLEQNEQLKSVLVSETPWLRQAKAGSQARRNVGVLFEQDRLERETARLTGKLDLMQLPDGTWPWFPGGRGNEYITLYITTGFGRLRHLGVEAPMGAALRSLDRLDGWADRMYRDILRQGGRDLNHLSPTIALYLYGRSFFLADRPVAEPYRASIDFWLGQARSHWLEVSERQTRGHLALALQRFGDPATAKAIMRSVREYAVTDEELGMFWRDTEHSWWWYRAPIETQALMIEAFDEVLSDSAAVEGCRVWLLKQKQTQDWKTTKATADAVYALLLRGTDVLSSQALVQVSLGDSLVRPGTTEAGTGFYEQRFEAAAITPAMGSVRVTRTDQGVAWGSVHWQYFEDLDKVTSYAGTPLKLVKTLFVRVNGKAGKELRPVTGPVHVGDELLVRVELRSDRDMEYVHLKDYRGSGVEPVNVLSGYRYQDGLAYYEETRDVASHFFIDYLPKGTYVFEYAVRVQLRGRYTSGVAEIQCLYAPEFNSHSGSVPLVVE